MRNTSERLLLKEGPCLVLQPEIVRHLGKSRALFLQQLHYWLTCEGVGKVIDQRRWIYNSAKEWAAQLCLSERQISRIIHHLKDLGLLMVDRLSARLSDRTNWYSINYRALESLFPDVSWQTAERSSVFAPSISSGVPDKMSGSFGHNGRLYSKETERTSEKKPLLTEGCGRRGVENGVLIPQVHVVSREREKKVFDKNTEESISPIQYHGTQNTLASDLLEIWNQTVSRQQGEGEIFLQLTKKRAQYLVAAFQSRFSSSLDQWKHFCHQITTSDFLMGKVKSTFKASLDWVLKFDILQRIVEGDFGVQRNSFVTQKGPSCQTEEEVVSQEIKTSLESQPIQGFRLSVLRTLGEKAYQSWFAKISIKEEGRAFVLTASSRFVRDYIQTHYGDQLRSLPSHRLNLSPGLC